MNILHVANQTCSFNGFLEEIKKETRIFIISYFLDKYFRLLK
jgi:hypothetical protein